MAKCFGFVPAFIAENVLEHKCPKTSLPLFFTGNL